MAENNAYTPENDTNLDTSLTQDDIYTPENDLDLDQSLVSTPIFSTISANASSAGNTISIVGGSKLTTTGASAAATGSTTDITGSTTLNTVTAGATGSGATIFIEPDFGTLFADADATGATLKLSGTTTLTTTEAGAAVSGGQNLNIQPVFKLSEASATASGTATTISGTTTLDTIESVATGSGGSTSIDLAVKETLEVPGEATATATGGESRLTIKAGIGAATTATGTGQTTSIDLAVTETLEVPNEATATGIGGQTIIDVQGNRNQITVLIEGERITTYTDIEVNKRLNEVSTFSFDAFIGEPNDRTLINEGNIVKIIEGYNTLLFKGKLTEVEYKSNFRAKCEGDGMVTKLLNRKTDRDTYNTNGDDIVKAEVDKTFINYGTIETAPQVNLRFDHDNLARAVAGVANATGYDWFIDQKQSEDYENDYLNFVEDAGNATSQATLAIGDDASLVERDKDEGFVANDITLLGRGDGINQLEANVFAASTAFTDTNQIIDENETGSFTVDDTSQLGSTGDDLLVRVGIETMDVTISDSTTLDINSRAVDDYAGNETGQIKHYENIRVWRVENKTTGVGRFTPEERNTAEDGSSIESKGVKEQRDTDKTIVDLSTLEKTADLELKNRFEDVFRVQTRLSDPSQAKDFQLGDVVTVQDLTAMDVDDEFDIVGMDHMRSSADEGTVLHLANRPRRLTERLSEIESDRDTLNAHMQGATNINGEHFEDNCDNTHPLTNKIYVPEDVVSINKFNVVFARESFRGYVQNTDHSHTVEITHPSHSHSVDVTHPDHDHDVTVTHPDHNHSVTIPDHSHQYKVLDHEHPVFTNSESVSDKKINYTYSHEDSNGNYQINEVYIASDSGKEIWTGVQSGNVSDTTDDGGGTTETTTSDLGDTETSTSTDALGTTNSETSETALGTTNTETSDDSGSPDYGIYELASEPDVDVEVKVDGNTVKTINDVSVGQEITNVINLKQYLADPLTGAYHDIELVPKDTGGGNNGRCKLVADVNQKVFIESTL